MKQKKGLGREIHLAVREANLVVHREAKKQLDAKMQSKDAKFIDQVTDFLRNAATGNDPTIEVVKLSTKGFKRAKFGKKYVQNIKDAMPFLKVEVNKQPEGDAETVIYDSRKGKSNSAAARLFKIRGKIIFESKTTKTEGYHLKIYVRNLIESGDLMFDLASDL